MKLRRALLSRVDLYIFEELMAHYVGASLFFFFTFFMLQLLRLSDFLIVHHVPLPTVLHIAFSLLLSFSHFVFPTAFLAAVLMTFGKLSGDSELIAMKSVGYSTERLARPVFVFGVFVSVISLLIGFEFAPWGERTMTQALFTAGSKKIVHSIKPQTFSSDFFDLVIYANEVNDQTGGLTGVFLYDERQPDNPLAIVAQYGKILNVRSESEFARQAQLKLYQGTIYKMTPRNLFSRHSGSSENMSFREYSLNLKMDAAQIGAPNIPRMASYSTLVERIAASEPKSHDFYDFSTEYWKRFSLSLSPLIFVFLGIGLGSVRIRSAQTSGILFTLITAVMYWGTLIFSVTIAKEGTLPPVLMMQMPNLVIMVIATFAYRRVRF